MRIKAGALGLKPGRRWNLVCMIWALRGHFQSIGRSRSLDGAARHIEGMRSVPNEPTESAEGQYANQVKTRSALLSEALAPAPSKFVLAPSKRL